MIVIVIVIVYLLYLITLGLGSFCYTLSGRTGSALVWHSEGRTIEALSVQQVL